MRDLPTHGREPRRDRSAGGIRRRPGLLLVSILGVVSVVAAGCGDETERDEAAALLPVVVQLRWLHQAQFAGMYAAADQGFYADAGMEVTFVEGGEGKDVLAEVVSGRADIGVAGGVAVLQRRAAGDPVKAVAVIYRRSPEAFVALASSGIQSPRDFAGRTISREPGDVALLHAMTRSVGVDPSQYVEQQSTDNVADLISGEVDVINAFLMNEPDRLRKGGHEVKVFSPDDYGVHAYADVLVATDETLDADGPLVRRFVAATVAGWQYAVDNPGEVARLVQCHNPAADDEHETRFMAISRPLISTGEDPIGAMRAEIWRSMAALLEAEELIPAGFDPETAYTSAFLPKDG